MVVSINKVVVQSSSLSSIKIQISTQSSKPLQNKEASLQGPVRSPTDSPSLSQNPSYHSVFLYNLSVLLSSRLSYMLTTGLAMT